MTPDAFLAAAGDGWEAEDGVATRTFDTGSWDAGLALVARLGALATELDHHPDVDLRYRTVTVRLTTHDAGGLSERDVAFARALAEPPPAAPSLGERRLAVVRHHMEAENVQEFDAVIDTFAHPRYELMPSGRVFDGEEEVRRYFASSRRTFPDQRNEASVLRLVDDGVVAEFDLLGTHVETGRSFRSRMVALFLFAGGGDEIVCERVYFDRQAIDEQVR